MSELLLQIDESYTEPFIAGDVGGSSDGIELRSCAECRCSHNRYVTVADGVGDLTAYGVCIAESDQCIYQPRDTGKNILRGAFAGFMAIVCGFGNRL